MGGAIMEYKIIKVLKIIYRKLKNRKIKWGLVGSTSLEILNF